MAVAATAVVHLANNLFKVFLVGRQADWQVVARFALPGAVAAMAGAWLLNLMAGAPPMFVYRWGEQQYEVTAVKLVIGILIILFALLDLAPRLRSIAGTWR